MVIQREVTWSGQHRLQEDLSLSSFTEGAQTGHQQPFRCPLRQNSPLWWEEGDVLICILAIHSCSPKAVCHHTDKSRPMSPIPHLKFFLLLFKWLRQSRTWLWCLLLEWWFQLYYIFSDLKFCGVFWFKQLDLIGSASFEPLRLSVKVLSVDFRVLPSLQSFSGFAQPPLQLFAQH